MEETNAILNARINALEHQRNSALNSWAVDRANLEIARAAIKEQDALIAALQREKGELEARLVMQKTTRSKKTGE